MNRLFRKIISIVLLLGVVCSVTITPTHADTDVTSDYQAAAIKLLSDLGLTEEKDANSTFTRRELAEILVKSMGYEIDNAVDTIFHDVKKDDEKSGAIQQAANLKIINGYSDGYFRPYDEVTYYQAIKTLVCITGYEIFAELNGGFPEGYVTAARRADILNGISYTDGEDTISFGDFAVMLKNSLTIDMLDIVGAGSNGLSYNNKSGKTLLKDYLNIITETGKLTETEFTALTGDSTLSENQIRIDKTVYNTTLDLTNDIGKKFVFYIKKDNSGANSVIAVDNGSYKNKTIQFALEDVSDVTNDEIEYVIENSRPKKLRFSADTDLIYNGKTQVAWGPENFYNDPSGNPSLNGEIRLVDIEGDGICDVVFVDHYVNRAVDTVNAVDEVLFFKNAVSDAKINLGESGVQYSLKDAEGNTLKLSDLYEWCIISVSKSADGKLYRMRAGNEYLQGMVTGIFDDYVMIDEKEYKITADCLNEVKMGRVGVFYFDYKNVIAAVDYDMSDDSQYGYLVNMALEGTFSADTKFKVFTQNAEHVVFDAADKVVRNGLTVKEKDLEADTALYEGGAVIPQLIRYKLNDSGEIRELYTAKDLLVGETSGELNLHAKYNQIRYRGANMKSIASRYILGNNTVVFAVPADLSDETQYSIYKNTNMLDDMYCNNVKVYDVDVDERIGAMVMDTVTSGMVSYNSNVGLVTDVWNVLDDEGNQTVKLILSVYGKTVELTPYDNDLQIVFNNDTISDLSSDPAAIGGAAPMQMDVSQLQCGDVIQYATNSNGKLIEAQLFLRGQTPISMEYAPNFSSYKDVYNATYYCYGRVIKEIDGGIMLDVKAQDQHYERVLPCYSATVYLAYDTERETYSVISLADIYPDEMVFVHARLSNVTTVIVYR